MTPLLFCSFYYNHNSEMEGRRELSDVLNWREICSEDLWNLSKLIKMFSWKSLTKMLTPTCSLDFTKVAIGILVRNFQENISMSSDGFQNLLNKILFNLRRHPNLYELLFHSYDWSKMRKNVTVGQSYVDKPFYSHRLGPDKLLFFSSMHLQSWLS